LGILILAWGNIARQDDGLGPAVAAEAERWALPGVRISIDYQLHVEDSHAISEAGSVIFVDASTEGDEPFSWQPVKPTEEISFSSHSIRPPSLLGLSKTCFGTAPEAWMLAIRGYRFEPFTEGLTPGASRNLEAAVAFLREQLTEAAA